MKKITIFITTMMLTLSMYSQWAPLTSGTTATLLGASFINDNTGWIVGAGGTIINTTDGTTFTAQNSGTGQNLYSVWFFDANTGDVVGDDNTILRTTDGGATWNPVSCPVTAQFRKIWFLNSSVGYITGGLAGVTTVLKSTDGGASWNDVSPTLFSPVYGICFSDANNGYLSDYNGEIYNTTNGGSTWNLQTTGVTTNIQEVYCISSTNIIASGIDGVILRTTNAGTTWTQLNTGTSDWFNSIKFLNSTTGYIAGGDVGTTNNGNIYKTTDGGQTWNVVYTSSANRFYGSSIGGHTGYACGLNGTVVKNSDLGIFVSATVTNNICNGGNSGMAIASVNSGIPPYTYSWNTIPVQTTDTASNLTAGTYTLTVTDSIGQVASVTATITEPALLTINSTSPMNSNCNTNTGTITASISGGTPNYSYAWSNGSTTATDSNITAGTYSLTVTDANGCTAAATSITVGIIPPSVVPICMVTVDSLSTHNIIVWEKGALPPSVDSFRIYREVATNVYSNVGSVSNDSLSEYHDFGANPNVTSFKYKIGVLDSCSGVSSLSDYHNTIHLQYLGNGNLQWTLYEIENASNPVNYYIIYRDSMNTGNFSPISSTIPGGNSTFTDVNYSSYPNANYRVDVNWNISCTPTRSVNTLSTTHSNIIHPGITTSISQYGNSNAISIYPNPSQGKFELSVNDNSNKKSIITIYNSLGEIIYSEETANNTITIDLSNQAKGIYFAEIKTDKGMATKKIVVEK